MNWLDIVIAILLVVNLLVGLRTGLVKTVVSFGGLILGIFLAGRYYHSLGDRLTFMSSNAAGIAAYVIVLVVVLIVAGIIAWLLSKVISATPLGVWDHIGGAIFSLVTAAIFIGAILAIWAKYGSGGDIISKSVLGRFLLDKFPLVLGLLPGEFGTVRSFFK